MAKCSKCKTNMVLMQGDAYFTPDSEPYESGEELELDIEIDRRICCHYCEKCNKIETMWED